MVQIKRAAAQRGCRLVCAAQMSVWKSVSCPSGQVWQIAECMVLCCSALSAAPHANGAEVPCIGARSVQSAPCLAACSCDSCPAPALQGAVCPLSGRQGSGLSGAKLPVAKANHPVLQWLTISATATEKADLAASERRICADLICRSLPCSSNVTPSALAGSWASTCAAHAQQDLTSGRFICLAVAMTASANSAVLSILSVLDLTV